MDAASFRADLARARAALEDASGQAVTGYRAPSFSIDPRNLWAFPVLAEAGYAYSSSVAPVAHDHYGWRDAPRYAFRPLKDSPLVELPVTVARVAGRHIATGGGFFRMLPGALTDFAVRQVNAEGHAGIFYFHPWEVDPDQPRVAEAPLRSKPRLDVREANLGDVRESGAIDAFVRAAAEATPFHLTGWSRAVARGSGQRARYLVASHPDGDIAGVLPLTEMRSPLFGRALVSTGFGVDGGILGDGVEARASAAGLGDQRYRLSRLCSQSGGG
ncbi:hypothetical protein WR25_22576 [Diploscapter pachys]|uniref:DUF3473 domain-containing protein n=1 Tax=Diploscapter pachys TaxID=2018661 RepID=A0A2A2K084_9BILA|nr:hypothetical protein WR25_22576 [Diploscapter pachys]